MTDGKRKSGRRKPEVVAAEEELGLSLVSPFDSYWTIDKHERYATFTLKGQVVMIIEEDEFTVRGKMSLPGSELFDAKLETLRAMVVK